MQGKTSSCGEALERSHELWSCQVGAQLKMHCLRREANEDTGISLDANRSSGVALPDVEGSCEVDAHGLERRCQSRPRERKQAHLLIERPAVGLLTNDARPAKVFQVVPESCDVVFVREQA